MPKMKSHSGAKKRFRLTATGKVKRYSQNKSHILSKKSTIKNRNLRFEYSGKDRKGTYSLQKVIEERTRYAY